MKSKFACLLHTRGVVGSLEHAPCTVNAIPLIFARIGESHDIYTQVVRSDRLDWMDGRARNLITACGGACVPVLRAGPHARGAT